MELVFEQIRTGGDRNFGYLLGDRASKQAALIDPSYAPDELIDRAVAQELKVTLILNTHSHPDHTNGNSRAQERTQAPIAAFTDSPILPDQRISDEEVLEIGALRLRCIHTPGHCDDHLVLFEPKWNLLVTGDLLFVGKVGGTSTDVDARIEYNSLRRMVEALPHTATVWPGHDYGVRPASTLALELATNPFLLCKDLSAFLRLKDDWAIFKKLHGLK